MTDQDKTPILSLRQIRKTYGLLEVLHGIDLDVYAGEVVALLGEKRCGKIDTLEHYFRHRATFHGSDDMVGGTLCPHQPA